MTLKSQPLSLISLAVLALSTCIALAQQPPAPPAPDAAPAAAPIERQPPSNPGMMHPGMMQNRHKENGTFRHDGEREHKGFGLVGEGMWWKNPMVVQRLSLTPDQTAKMDEIFQKSRLQLIDLKANVEKQDALLDPLLSANPPETAKALAQIDKVADARADLEKASARMFLSIRGILTPEQWGKLHEAHGPGGFAPQGGPGGFGGKGFDQHGGHFIPPPPQQ